LSIIVEFNQGILVSGIYEHGRSANMEFPVLHIFEITYLTVQGTAAMGNRHIGGGLSFSPALDYWLGSWGG